MLGGEKSANRLYSIYRKWRYYNRKRFLKALYEEFWYLWT
nr:MAG TPA: hypothetical protein [Caudoviricetes sp.]